MTKGSYIAAFLVFFLTSFFTHALSINQTFENALQAFHQEKYQDSIIHLKNILSEDANHLPSRVLMAENLLVQGKAGAAEVELKFAIQAGADKFRITPLLAKAYLLQTNYQQILDIHIPETSSASYQSTMQTYVGYAYLGQRHYHSATQAFNQALTFSTENIEALIGLAKIKIQQEKIDLAIPILEQALALDDEHKQALLMLAIVYKLQNKTTAALVQVNQLIQIDDKNYSALLTRAMLLSSLDQHEKAVADLDIIILHYPNEPIANYIRLITSQSEEDTEEAKKIKLHLMAVLSAIPAEAKTEQPVFLFLTGLVNFQNNAMENAQKSLFKYHKIAPEDLTALTLLARSEMALGDYYSAKKYLVKAHLLDESNSQIWALLARNYMMTDELDKAEFYFKKVVNNKPNDLTAIIDLATLYLVNENFNATQALLEPATTIDSENTEQKTQVLVMLLKALQKLQKFNTAIVYSQQLLILDKNNSYAHQIHGSLLALQGNVHQARSSFLQAIALDNSNFQAVMYLARVESLLGNTPQSIILLKSALKSGPNSALYIELGDVYYGIGDLVTSMVWYQKALAHNPSSMLALDKIVVIHLSNNRLDEAITITDGYIQSFDDNAQAYRLSAKLYQQQGNYKKSLSQMNWFVKLATDRADAFYQLAQLQLAANTDNEAILSLQKSIAWQRDFKPAYLSLISLYSNDKEQEKALTLINEFSPVVKDTSLIARLRADLYWATAQPQKALTFYQQSYQITENRKALLGIYRIYRSNKQYSLVNALLNSWLNKHPDDLTLAISLAENYRPMGELNKASQYYKDLVENNPDNAVILNNAAIIHRELRQYEQAAQLSELAYQLMPQHVTILDTKAWIEFYRGNYTTALALLRKANTLEYENAEVKYHLAATLAKLNRLKEAKKYLKESVRSPQDYPEKSTAKALLGSW